MDYVQDVQGLKKFKMFKMFKDSKVDQAQKSLHNEPEGNMKMTSMWQQHDLTISPVMSYL